MRDKIYQKIVLHIFSIALAMIVMGMCYCTHEPEGRINPCDPNGENYFYVSLGNDTSVSIYDTINLNGTVAENEKISKWEWKFGDSNWISTSGSDTTIIAPGYEGDYTCILKVTNDKGMPGYAAKKITVINSNSLLSIIVNDSFIGVGDTVLIYGEIPSIVDVKKWEWKFNNSNWFETSGCDTNLVFSLYIPVYTCSLRVTNNYETKIYASREILVHFFKYVSLVSTGNKHTMILNADGTFWGTGRNYFGQLGDGTLNDKKKPVQIMSGVLSVCAGAWHTMILKIDGTLWATGSNNNGQLGDGTNTSKNEPVQIMSGVSSVSAGEQHTMIIKTDGTLWGTGYNSSGQLGDGTNVNKNIPVQIMSEVSSVSADYCHTMIIKNDSTLWATGSNSYGQLGDGTNISKNEPVQIMSGVSSVSAGGSLYSYYTMILKADGTLWATGNNEYSQLGDGTNTNKNIPVQIMSEVFSVSTGGRHSMIIKTEGTIWGTGYNYFGQLGDGTNVNKNIPVQIMSEVSSASAGEYHTMILKTDGTLWGTGYNDNGQLGDGTTINKNKPVRI